MAGDSSAPNGAAPPPAVLWQMMTGYWVSQAIYVAAKLGVADLLVDGPRPVEELAAATQADSAALRRVLRALASSGVFTETSPGAFALTPMAALLRSGVPDSMRSLAIMTKSIGKVYLARYTHSSRRYSRWQSLSLSTAVGTGDGVGSE